MDYIYDNGFMSNLRIIVGKTGSGKTNFLQLIGMDWWNREDTAESDIYRKSPLARMAVPI